MTQTEWPRSGLARGSIAVVMALLVGACGGTTATTAPSAGASAAPASQNASGAPAGTKFVSILNQNMTDDQIKAEVAKEGSLVVANWTQSINDELIKQFKDYVKANYGADIQFTYEGTQAPSAYLTNLFAAQKAGNTPPYDLLAVEENYWDQAMSNNAVADFLPSDLVPNQKLILPQLQHAPTSIAFQATAFATVVYNKATAPFIKSLKDLADPRLKGKVTMPLPGDITAGGFFLELAAELGKDYKDPAQMKEVVDWAIANIGPNVLKYTTDSSQLSQLLESGAATAVVFWNSMARLEALNGHPDMSLVIPSTVYAVNGYMWIPKGAPHPVLAQIFVNWRLSPEVEFPNTWPISHGAWAEFNEGYMGPSYVNSVPDWFKSQYETYFPTLDQFQSAFKAIDWAAYNATQQDWQNYYAQKIGL